jgi:PAS domain S-box-containing protein
MRAETAAGQGTRRIVLIATGLAAALAGFALLGWLASNALLRGEWYPGEPAMKPLTALIVLLLVGAILLRLAERPAGGHPAWPWIRLFCGGTTFLLALVAALDNFDLQQPFLQAIERQLLPLQQDGQYSSTLSAACLALLALGQLYGTWSGSKPIYRRSLTFPVYLLSSWAIIENLVNLQSVTGMALHSAVACLLLAVAIDVQTAEPLLVATLESPRLSGRLMRLLPLALVIPILFGAVPLLAERSGRLPEHIADGLMVMLFVISIFAGYLLTIRYVATAEQRTLAEHQLRQQQVLAAQQQAQALSLLQATLESTAEGVIVFGHDNRISAYNRNFAEMWGMPDELLGAASDRETVLACEAAQLVDSAAFLERAAAAAQQPLDSFAEVLHLKDGRVFERHAIPQLLDGRAVGRVVSIRDVTDQARALAAVEESQARLEDAQAAGGVGTWSVDLRSGRTYWSRQLFVNLGLEPDSAVPGETTLLAAVHPEDRQRVQTAIETFFSPDGQREMEYRVMRPDGSARWMHSQNRLVLDEQGAALRLLGIDQDITERRQSEVQREESLALLKATLESTAEGVLAFDLDGRINVCNQNFARMFGVPEALLARGDRHALMQFVASRLEDPEEFIARTLELIGRMHEPSFDVLRLQDGRVFERHTQPQFIDSQPVGRVVTLRDITSQTNTLEALREIQASLEDAQEAGGVGTWSLDLRTQRVYWSKQAYTNLGLDPATTEPGLEALFSVVHPDDLHYVKAITAALFDPEAAHEMEYRVVLPDGAVRWLHGRSRLVLDEAGQPLRLLGLDQDITERKRAEEELLRSQQALTNAQRVAHVGSWEWDLLTGEVTWSAEMYRIFGADKTKGAEAYAEVMQRIHPDDRARIEAALAHAIESCQVFQFEYRIELPDGRLRYVEGRGECTMIKDGRAARLVGTAQDITRRKLAQQELVRSLSLMQATLESTGEGVLAVDREGNITAYNHRFAEMWGVPQELLERGEDRLAMDSVLDKLEDPAAFVARVEALYHQPLADSYDQIRLKDGRIFERTSRPQVIGDESVGRVWGFVDVSPRLQAEQERQKLEDQLRQAQKMEAIGTLAGGIAHDFNNILAAILGYATLVRDELPEGSQLRADQQEVLTAAERATDLVRHILAFSRQHKAELAPVRLVAVVKEVLRLLRASLPSTIVLAQRTAEDVEDGAVLADVSQLHQVLMNLCTNAGYAMKTTGGKLEIGLRAFEVNEEAPQNQLAPGRYLLLSVKDNGPGIPPEIRERIFDPFFTTKAVGEGTGLGLSTVHGIVTGLGGAITVYSEVGSGTVFNVYLPRVDRTAAEQEQAAAELPHGHGRILFVDDEPAIAKMGQAILNRLGYNVTPAEGGPQAWALFQADPQAFDLLVTDQTMPGLTGDTLIERIRSLRPGFPIILCTGFSEILTDERVAELGVAAFLTKPIAPTVLAKAVEQALNGEPVADSNHA